MPLKPPKVLLWLALSCHLLVFILVLALALPWWFKSTVLVILFYNAYALLLWYKQYSSYEYFGYDGQFYLVENVQQQTTKQYFSAQGEFLASYFLVLLRLRKMDMLSGKSVSKPFSLVLHPGLLSAKDMSRINRVLR